MHTVGVRTRVFMRARVCAGHVKRHITTQTGRVQ